MQENVCLDTNIVAYYLNGDERVIAEVGKSGVLYLPFIAAGELLYGAKNSTKVERNLKVYRLFLTKCSVLFADGATSEIYSDIKIELKKGGKQIPVNDLWIAAIAKQNSLKLLTSDKHFTFINGLDLKYIEMYKV